MTKPLMKDRLKDRLRKGWTTPLQALSDAGCLSLSQRCGDFRRNGLMVVDKWVGLPDGRRVKAYRLPK